MGEHEHVALRLPAAARQHRLAKGVQWSQRGPVRGRDATLGELPDEPEELYRLATVANVACGGHAGDDDSMTRAVELARAGGARIAAHPSYPDRAGFGRKTMAIAPDALFASIREQLLRLKAIAGPIATVPGET